MAFWNADLTTSDGIDSAAQAGGLACFVTAGLTVLGFVLLSLAGLSKQPTVELVGGLAGVAIEFLVFVVAGFRLRATKGMVWGSVAAVLLVIEMISKIVTMTGIGGLVINALLLVLIVNGVRAAREAKRAPLHTGVATIFE